MKAIVCEQYGSPDNLILKEVDKPTSEDNEVLVKVRAASVHPDVWHVVTGFPYALRLMGSGLLRPKRTIPGTDMAGVVESVGEKATRFQPGDAVFGESLAGHQWKHGGAYAEYVAVPEDNLALKPESITFEQAATVPTSGMIALWNLDDGELIQPGDKVLINGAGGGVGSLALQIAKAMGAVVTAVDCTERLDLLRSLGADRVIDFTQENYTQGKEAYDLIFDIPGNYSFAECRRVLSPEGKYILIWHDNYGKSGGQWLGGLSSFFTLTLRHPFNKQLPDMNYSMPKRKPSMAILQRLLEEGEITPLVGRAFPLDEASQAFRCLIEGQTIGKIVLTV